LVALAELGIAVQAVLAEFDALVLVEFGVDALDAVFVFVADTFALALLLFLPLIQQFFHTSCKVFEHFLNQFLF
jgi:hypothetical protein